MLAPMAAVVVGNTSVYNRLDMQADRAGAWCKTERQLPLRIVLVAVLGGFFGFVALWFAPFVLDALPIGSLPRRGFEFVLQCVGLLASGLAQLIDPESEVLYPSDSNYGYTIYFLCFFSLFGAGLFVVVYLVWLRLKRLVRLGVKRLEGDDQER